MSPEVKQQLLASAEKLTEVSLSEAIAVAKVLAADSASPIDDGVVSAVELLKSAFLDGLVDQIDGQDG